MSSEQTMEQRFPERTTDGEPISRVDGDPKGLPMLDIAGPSDKQSTIKADVDISGDNDHLIDFDVPVRRRDNGEALNTTFGGADYGDLSERDMRQKTISYSIRGADLSDSDMRRAEVSADATGADVRGAKLDGTTWRADVSGIDFTRAASADHMDLSQAKGVDQCVMTREQAQLSSFPYGVAPRIKG